MRIHIIGPSGSGKTYLSQKLSEKTGIPCTSLDELFWENSYAVSNTKRDPSERDQMLRSATQQDNWIIEGVQHAWVGSSFEKADTIYLLEPPALLCRIRIIRRFVKRKLNGTGRKNETFRSLLDLLRWTKKFYRVNLPEIYRQLQPYQNKVIRIKNKKELQQVIQEKLIHLVEPKMEDLWFRQEMLSDAETMGYNHAWGGTISFPEERWAGWYKKWLGGNKNYFYRYLAEGNENFVGEAAYHYDDTRECYLCDVIVHAKYRGRGYGRQGLCLLCDAARANGLTELYDDIAADNPAIKLFLNRGFFVVSETEESITVKKLL